MTCGVLVYQAVVVAGKQTTAEEIMAHQMLVVAIFCNQSIFLSNLHHSYSLQF
jgi:hypothetical protein